MAEPLLPWQQTQWQRLNIAREHGRLPHALLLTGPAGLGKFEFARLLGNSLLCEAPGVHNIPCGICKQCRLAMADGHPDITDISPQEAGKAIKVDAIRELVNRGMMSVAETRYRVFIINPAEAMGVAAANALLKTLEEPVARTLLILISASPGRLLATIKSRCQQLAFAVPAAALAHAWLSQQLGEQGEKAADLLQLARGAPLLARQMAEGDELECYNQLLKQFLLLAGSRAEPVILAEQWHKQQDISLLLNYMKRWLIEIILAGNGAGADGGSPSDAHRDLQSLGKRLDLRAIHNLLDSCFETERRLANNINPQLALEQLLLRWVHVNKHGVT